MYKLSLNIKLTYLIEIITIAVYSFILKINKRSNENTLSNHKLTDVLKFIVNYLIKNNTFFLFSLDDVLAFLDCLDLDF